jgi:hypothetical protein
MGVAKIYQHAQLDVAKVNTYGALSLITQMSLVLLLLHLPGLQVGRILDGMLNPTSTFRNGRHPASGNEAEHAAPRMRAMPQRTSVPPAVSFVHFPQLGVICVQER